MENLELQQRSDEDRAASIPVFAVLKKGVFVKNIFLDVPVGNQDKCRFLMGRNPDCQIVVDHPSISRFHLELHVLFPRKLAVTDLSSVHGTYVSGKKIEPLVTVELAEGDLLRLGASTRAYVLRWAPLGDVGELENPLAPLPEEKEEDSHRVDGYMTVGATCGGLRNTTVPSAPPMPEWMRPSPANGCAGAVSSSQATEWKESEETSFFARSSPMTAAGEETSAENFCTAEVEELRPPISKERVMSSGILSRRSKSVCLLRVHTGRSREGLELDTSVAKLETRSGNGEGSIEGEDEDETFVSDKENMTPELSTPRHKSILSICKDLFSGPKEVDYSTGEGKEEDEADHFVDKENMTPGLSPPSNKSILSICKDLFSGPKEVDYSTGEGNEEDEADHFVDKENMTPGLSPPSNKSILSICKDLFSGPKEVDYSTGEGKEEDEADHFVDKENMTPGLSPPSHKSTLSIHKVLFSSPEEVDYSIGEGKEEDEADHFVDKENMAPSQKSERALQEGLCECDKKTQEEEGSEDFTGWKGEDNDAEFIVRKEEEEFLGTFMVPVEEVLNGVGEEEHQKEEEEEDDDDDDNEVFFSDKENLTPGVPQSVRARFEKVESNLQKSIVKLGFDLDEADTRQSSWRADMSIVESETQRSLSKLNIGLDADNNSSQGTAAREQFPCDGRIDDGNELVGFTPDKENQMPQSSKPSKLMSGDPWRIEMDIEKGRVERVPLRILFENSNFCNTKTPPSEAIRSMSENSTKAERGTEKRRGMRVPFQALAENSISIADSLMSPYKASAFAMKSKQASSENSFRHQKVTSSKRRVERIPFQSLLDDALKENSPCGGPEISSNYSVNQSMEQAAVVHEVAHASRKKTWNIVADISCFLNEESRKSLQMLEGMRGTHLIIPRMVIRELDYLKRRESLFRRRMKASTTTTAVLQWIERCMVNTSWWIHVQSNGEIVPVVATPPASPSIELKQENDDGNDVDDELNRASNAIAAAHSKYPSLAEIASPTAEDHILDCALLFKRIKHDGHLVLLTDSVPLKIKAMAEGLLCETAREFRESLVSPFSERFLWEESSPRGPTWSYADEVKLVENHYQHCPTIRKSVKAAEGAKGLKLVLLHNSRYEQQAHCFAKC